MINKFRNNARRKLISRWEELTASSHSLRALAENFSQVARDALDESKQLIVEHQKIYLPRLPPQFHGWRVIQLSDIHHSPLTRSEQIEKAIEITNSLEPDIIVLTGDYVSHETAYIGPVAEMLGRLVAKQGVFAILGNHDHWTDAPLITDLLRAEGIKVLINEGLRFEFNQSQIWLCGVDETMVGLDDLDQALAGARPDEFKFLLCHNPAILRKAALREIDFVVAGHTHGGQIRLKKDEEDLFLPRHRSASGLFQRGKTQIYISRGIGTVVLPIRYQCPPEIGLLELCSGKIDS